jgi:hypothetical protein
VINRKDIPMLLLADMGRASKTTKGIFYILPWYETALPPFNRRCNNC